MNLWTKFFCSHKWESHVKQPYIVKYKSHDILGNYYDTGLVDRYTKEVLICEKCGKIKTLKY